MITLRQTISFVIAMITLIFIVQVANAAKLQKTHSKAKVTATSKKAKATKAAKPEVDEELSLDDDTHVKVTGDRAVLRDARIAFEKKDYKKALSLYEKIPQTSDYWIEALEERAWSHVHLKEHDQALANLKTLFAPPIKNEIGAEPYLLSSLVQLRLCNYNEIFKGMKRFKEDIRPRYEALQALAKTGETESSVRTLGRALEANKLSRAAAGSDMPNLPHLFYRDIKLQDAFKAKNEVAMSQRMKALAQRDVKETEAILRKLHLVEVESVSRMFAEQNLADGKKASPGIVRNANTLVFPDDDNDVWLDELDSYRVNSKGCPAPGKGPKS